MQKQFKCEMIECMNVKVVDTDEGGILLPYPSFYWCEQHDRYDKFTPFEANLLEKLEDIRTALEFTARKDGD